MRETSGRSGRRRAAQPAYDGDVDQRLLDRLKAKRRELAEAQGVPAYVVFPDRTLIEIAGRKPGTLAAFGDIHGVGQAKLERYGAAFLEIVGAE